MLLRRCWLALAFALTLASGACGPARAEAGIETLTIVSGGASHEFQVEIARNEAQRAQGLMYRRFMPADRGMLFEFQAFEPVAFWMKNTYIPLDMIFIDREGRVTRIVANAEPLSETALPSGAPCIAVLELNGGVAAKIGLHPGDQIKHPFFKS